MPRASKELALFVKSSFEALADPLKAGPMAAYMKTEMPFYGIQKPERNPVYKEMKRRFAPRSRQEYEAGVLALWELSHREEKYAALEFACQHGEYIVFDSLPLFIRLVEEGQWWDFVDVIAVLLVGTVLLKERQLVKPLMEEWIVHRNFWVRRTALLAHNHHKQQTDGKQLFKHCLRCADEREFFIRKAIGWSLREYSYAEPQKVKRFLLSNRQELSALSFREGSKALMRKGLMSVS